MSGVAYGAWLPILEVERSRIEGEGFWGRSTETRQPWLIFPIFKIENRALAYGGLGVSRFAGSACGRIIERWSDRVMGKSVIAGIGSLAA
jgi:hypothetical protein